LSEDGDVHGGEASSSAATPSSPQDLLNFDGPTGASSGSAAPGAQQAKRPPTLPLRAAPQREAPKTKAELTKERYAKLQSTQKRVWDEVEQRWRVDGESDSITGRNVDYKPGAPKAPGIRLDTPIDTTGKDPSVVAAMQERRADMKEAQAKAKQEIRDRETKKKQEEEAEAQLRQRLDPRLKEWSEEYGKKKNIRALLVGLDSVLWEGAKWKPVSMADIIPTNKVKITYLKATRVVHPDRTVSLDIEKRFMAKRIFDALTQAYQAFEESPV